MYQELGPVQFYHPDPYQTPPYAPRPKMECQSLACQSRGRCTPYLNSAGVMAYPSDCSTGAQVGTPYGDDTWYPGKPVDADAGVIQTVPTGTQGTPIGQSPSASTPAPLNILEMFQGMSTSTLIILGAAAYFFFFRKGR